MVSTVLVEEGEGLDILDVLEGDDPASIFLADDGEIRPVLVARTSIKESLWSLLVVDLVVKDLCEPSCERASEISGEAERKRDRNARRTFSLRLRLLHELADVHNGNLDVCRSL